MSSTLVATLGIWVLKVGVVGTGDVVNVAVLVGDTTISIPF